MSSTGTHPTESPLSGPPSRPHADPAADDEWFRTRVWGRWRTDARQSRTNRRCTSPGHWSTRNAIPGIERRNVTVADPTLIFASTAVDSQTAAFALTDEAVAKSTQLPDRP